MRFPWLFLPLVVSACSPPASPAAPSTSRLAPDSTPKASHPATDVAGEVAFLQFHSAFWPNLHHVLYAEAWSRRGGRSQAGALPAPLSMSLAPEEREAWDAAVAYYDRELAAKDLLFDPAMADIRRRLAQTSADGTPAGLAPEHLSVLNAAAPVYRTRWWSEHDRRNRTFVATALPRVRALVPMVPDRLARLYGTPWFTSPVRVDVVYVGKRQGAYTSVNGSGAHITIASTDPRHEGWAAAEILFHEASHALVRPTELAFDAEARAQGKSLQDLWHVALFYLTGEVVRQSIPGETYRPYLEATGLFDRAWPQFRTPLETYWQPYVDGRVPVTEAVRNVVSACD